MNLNALVPILLLGGGAAFLFLTPQGKQLLASLTGGGFATYDPKNTDLFPFADLLEKSRNDAKDFVADAVGSFKPFDKANVKIPAGYKGLYGR